jgi:hypothetical protein
MIPARCGAWLLTGSLLAAIAGCASADEPGAPELAPVTATVAVQVFGDGFVRCDQRRLPLELFVLELRQRVRSMPKADVAGLHVVIAIDQDGGDAAVRAAERLVDELQVMGVQQGQLR